MTQPSQSTALVPQRVQTAEPFQPQDLVQARQLSEDIAQSALVPPALRGKVYDVYVTVMWGRDLGLSPMQSVFGVWIEPRSGRPGLYEQTAIALVQRSPFCKYIRCIHSDGESATWETQRVGHPEPDRATFTIEQAKKAGLVGKDNWKAYPEDMLSARAAYRLARRVYPDVLANVYSPDELMEIRDREVVDVTSVITAPPPPPSAPPPAKGAPGTPRPAQDRIDAEHARQGGKNTSRPEEADAKANSPADVGYPAPRGRKADPKTNAAAEPAAPADAQGATSAGPAAAPSTRTEADDLDETFGKTPASSKLLQVRARVAKAVTLAEDRAARTAQQELTAEERGQVVQDAVKSLLATLELGPLEDCDPAFAQLGKYRAAKLLRPEDEERGTRLHTERLAAGK